MKNETYLEETLNDSWKRVTDGVRVEDLDWDGSNLIVTIDGSVKEYEYFDFFKHYTLTTNEKKFDANEDPTHGWILLLNAVDLFSQKEDKFEKISKEPLRFYQYITERHADLKHYMVGGDFSHLNFITNNVKERIGV